MRVSRPRRRKRQIRITYEAAPVEKEVITGAERIQGWEKVEGTDGIWCVAIDNALFGDFNPYTTELFGDWIIYPCPCHVHLGDVYLNGHSLYEAMSLEDVKHPVMRTEGVGPDWEGVPEKVLEPENTLYQWYTEQRDGKTVFSPVSERPIPTPRTWKSTCAATACALISSRSTTSRCAALKSVRPPRSGARPPACSRAWWTPAGLKAG